MSVLPVALLAAAVSFVDGQGHLSPAAFDFVKPGVSRSEIDKRLGKPYVSAPTVVVKDRIDLFPNQLPDFDAPRAKPQKTEDVHYYEYRAPDHLFEYARIVFRGDKVWYASLPPQSSEKTAKDLAGRYGDVFTKSLVRYGTRHMRYENNLYRIPSKGLAFLEGDGKITHRVVFPPVEK